MQGRVIVDADACPHNCLSILRNEQQNYGYRLITVASFNHNIDNADHIIVGNEKEAADIAVINQVRQGDLVVTQDWGLAALVLAKGAMALAPNGIIYRDENIDFKLEERSLKAKIRRAGKRTKGSTPARQKQDDQRFHKSLLKLLDIIR